MHHFLPEASERLDTTLASRKRNLLIIGLVGLLLAGSIAAIVLKPTRLGLDLAGGIELIYKASPTDADRKPTDRELQNAIKVINERVNSLGVTEAEVQATRQRADHRLGLPDVDDPEEAKAPRRFDGEDALLQVGRQRRRAARSERLDHRRERFFNNQGATKQYDAVKLASEQKPRRRRPAATSTTSSARARQTS